MGCKVKELAGVWDVIMADRDDDLSVVGATADVWVDFSHPDALKRLLAGALSLKKPIVIGTTGYTDLQMASICEAAKAVPIVHASNFSMGMAVLGALVRAARKALPDFQVEIQEIHHKQKKDAPSGTALTLAKSLGDNIVLGRQGAHMRAPDEIGIAALRGGQVIGEHTVFFFGNAERLELTHRATNRDIFAEGALKAAQWVIDKSPGLYSIKDIL